MEGSAETEPGRLVSVESVRRHSTAEDCWLVIDGKVWDFSEFAPEHPGGAGIILKHAGRDATKAYNEIHAPSLVSKTIPNKLIGTLDTSTITEEWLKPPPSATPELKLDEKPPLETLISSHDFEEVASRTLTKKTWAFYSSAATDCITHKANLSQFDRVWFRPRVLRNVREVSTKTRILGVESSAPFFCSPAAMARMVHEDGEKGIARGCQSQGILQCVSTNASYPVHEISSAAPSLPLFFQLYVHRTRSSTKHLIESLPASVRAIFVTVDAAVPGKREADERVRADESLSTPMSGAKATNDKKGGALGRIMGSYIDPGLCWEDIGWLRGITKLPIVVKGIMNADDAKKAAESGVAGILLSNHGGRNLDTSPPPLHTLLEIHLRFPEIVDQVEFLIDGGIRRATDILKALCLGVTAVGLGRPFLYALNYGQEGVEHLIEILKDELEVTMRLNGITDLSQVGPHLVNTTEIDWMIPREEGHPFIKWKPKNRPDFKAKL